jgi:hypothetical protein
MHSLHDGHVLIKFLKNDKHNNINKVKTNNQTSTQPKQNISILERTDDQQKEQIINNNGAQRSFDQLVFGIVSKVVNNAMDWVLQFEG